MKITKFLQTTAQLRGMIDEVKAKRHLLVERIEKVDQDPENFRTISKDLTKLESDISGILLAFDLMDELQPA